MTDASVLERRTPPGKAHEDKITYIPGPQDGVSTTVGWNGQPGSGVTFVANIPQMISRKVTTQVLVRQERETADGQIVSRSVEKMVPLVELLRNNPFFSINDEPPPARAAGAPRLPTDPDTYRGYAIGWIAAGKDPNAMRLQWEGEEGMRNRLGVSADDLRHIVPFLDGRILEMGGARTIPAIPL